MSDKVKKFDDFMKSGYSKGKPDKEYNKEDLEKGAEIQEEEHGDPDIAKKIAKDHLEEHPLYYDDHIGLEDFEDELQNVEDQLKAAEEESGEYIVFKPEEDEELDKTAKEYDKEDDEELIVQKEQNEEDYKLMKDEKFKLFKESLKFDFSSLIKQEEEEHKSQ